MLTKTFGGVAKLKQPKSHSDKIRHPTFDNIVPVASDRKEPKLRVITSNLRVNQRQEVRWKRPCIGRKSQKLPLQSYHIGMKVVLT